MVQEWLYEFGQWKPARAPSLCPAVAAPPGMPCSRWRFTASSQANFSRASASSWRQSPREGSRDSPSALKQITLEPSDPTSAAGRSPEERAAESGVARWTREESV